MQTLPMFPLGTVLLPGGRLPLQVFEARYLQLLADLTPAGFGICLIERGSEVGGGDIRSMVGTRAVVEASTALDAPPVRLEVRGLERIQIDAWLEDDPYPTARVRPAPDPATGPDEDRQLEVLAERVDGIRSRIAVAIGREAPPPVEVSSDASLASHQLAGAVPLGPFDRHRLLACDTVGLRIALLEVLLDDVEEDLARLESEG